MTPKLYLSLGVSGAPEHVEGMQGAELIVAVNKDPGAAILSSPTTAWSRTYSISSTS